MEKQGKAYFVYRPRTIEDLKKPHLIEKEQPYVVTAEVVLEPIDYNNFITDMLADRQFIEDYDGARSEGQPLQCLLVRCMDARDGILVSPDPVERHFVRLAAYVTIEN